MGGGQQLVREGRGVCKHHIGAWGLPALGPSQAPAPPPQTLSSQGYHTVLVPLLSP